jgi:hypothetical protein
MRSASKGGVMNRKSIYLESTIPSYITGRTSSNIIVAAHQISTHQFWDKEKDNYDFCISQYVIDDCKLGDEEAAEKRLDWLKGIRLLPISAEVEKLAVEYQNLLAIPEKAKEDSFHLAICVVEHIDYLLTWNCRHLGPRSLIDMVKYNTPKGLWAPVLTTPDLFESEEENNG